MPDANDMRLLRDYCAAQSETAFETLVHRHVNLVYSTALRQIGNPAQAEEITQAVFIILARKAARLRPDTILPAWLHETTRYVTASYLRGEIRRRRREQEAYMQSTLNPAADDSTWEQLAPLLDEAIGRLGPADRNAVVLRYFQNKSAQEIAAALNLNEAAARKRLTRAVEKLRLYFSRRGVDVSAGALGEAVSSHAVMAPPGLANTAAMAALVKGSTVSVSTLTLVKGALKIMAWSKIKTAIIAGAVVILTAGVATPILVHSVAHHHHKRPMPIQIHIKTRFFEVPKSFFTKANSLPVALTNGGILASTDAQNLIRQMASFPDVEELAEPEVTTIAGRHTEMRATRNQNVITNFSATQNPTGDHPDIMDVSPQMTKVEVGPIVDVVPRMLPNGRTIDLNTTVSLIEFYGYAAPRGLPIRYATNSVTGDKIILPNSLPAFQVSETSMQKTLFDGQTLVLFPVPQPRFFSELDEQSQQLVTEHIRQANVQYGNKVLLVLTTATLIDAAGNRLYPGD